MSHKGVHVSEVQSTEPETVLQFPLPDVIELVAHSLSCTEHIESYSQREAGKSGATALTGLKTTERT